MTHHHGCQDTVKDSCRVSARSQSSRQRMVSHPGAQDLGQQLCGFQHLGAWPCLHMFYVGIQGLGFRVWGLGFRGCMGRHLAAYVKSLPCQIGDGAWFPAARRQSAPSE